MPDDKDEWITQDHNFMKISKCAYWCYLKGKSPIVNESSTKRITIPKTNIFSVETLSKMKDDIHSRGDINDTY
jgi:hypothetical protein